jgi:hypothetical protein
MCNCNPEVGGAPGNGGTSIPGLQFAKTLPGLAVEAHELHLVHRHVIGRTGVELDARQQQRQFQVFDGVSLLENIFGREIVAAGSRSWSVIGAFSALMGGGACHGTGTDANRY